jgi:hypothetical protein
MTSSLRYNPRQRRTPLGRFDRDKLYTRGVHVRLDDEMNDWLENWARKNGMSKGEAVRVIIEREMEK